MSLWTASPSHDRRAMSSRSRDEKLRPRERPRERVGLIGWVGLILGDAPPVKCRFRAWQMARMDLMLPPAISTRCRRVGTRVELV